MDNESDDWSNGPAPVFTPMSYPRLQEFNDAQKAYNLVERVISMLCCSSDDDASLKPSSRSGDWRALLLVDCLPDMVVKLNTKYHRSCFGLLSSTLNVSLGMYVYVFNSIIIPRKMLSKLCVYFIWSCCCYYNNRDNLLR